ncbi:hypothetical protein Lfu02_23270 [Longispora fulva]|uniref:Uncharacterized protein n=1 Tax=Longispora fulva TaxID=619741 RepID=A0A8J7GXG9_9ACTN|nr:hypothetical protein [Longispora fulva]MBG6139663.1 hypothetical protein [Longispora fulva]GIG57955.1 hypothetical protein Lfu02_23270 [Longispora fulva]
MRRLQALATAGLLGAACAVLGAGTAFADSPTVTFSGGCGLLGVGAHSRPSVPELTVTEMTSVRFINALRIRADLVLPGGARYTLNPGTYLELQIASGPAEALMEPACGLGLLPSYEKVTIQVEPTPSPEGGPEAPAQTSAPAAPAPPAPHSGPSRPNPRPPAPEPVPSAAVEAPGAAVSPTLVEPTPSTATSSASGPIEQPAIEPVAAGQVPGRASSLLAMVATVCVIGVSAAAVRAIGAQRTVRTTVT